MSAVMFPKGPARDLLTKAVAQGWTVEKRKTGHVKFMNPKNGEIVFAAGTPSDWRATKNLQARLRRAGLKV